MISEICIFTGCWALTFEFAKQNSIEWEESSILPKLAGTFCYAFLPFLPLVVIFETLH